MDTNVAQFLIQQKLETLRATNEVSMSWWVSSTLLSATILGVVWKNTKAISGIGKPFLGLLTWGLSFFFVSIVLYGLLISSYYVFFLHPSISDLLKGINVETSMFRSEVLVSVAAILNGTTSFIVALLGWYFLRQRILGERLKGKFPSSSV